MKKAVFFDLDGTLWDALIPNLEAWNLAMEKLNQPYRFDLKTIKSFMGLTPDETAKLAFPQTPIEEGKKLFKDTLKISTEYMKTHPGSMYPDEIEVLKELKKDYPLFIVSNCESGYIENFLNGCNTKDYFIDHTCVGDTGLEKWQNILFLKDKYSIEEVIYVGDTNKDFVEATKANVKFVHAHYGFQKDVPCTYKIDSLKELALLLKIIFN